MVVVCPFDKRLDNSIPARVPPLCCFVASCDVGFSWWSCQRMDGCRKRVVEDFALLKVNGVELYLSRSGQSNHNFTVDDKQMQRCRLKNTLPCL